MINSGKSIVMKINFLNQSIEFLYLYEKLVSQFNLN